MAAKTKLEFVSEIIADNPNATRLGIINKLVRHRREYRGKKFDRTSAAYYYWQVTTGYVPPTKREDQTVSITYKVPRSESSKFKKYVKAIVDSGLIAIQ